MIAFRLLTLLVIVFGVASSHLPNTDDDNFAKLFKMMENLTNQQQELKVKVMDSLAIQNEKLSDFEVKVNEKLSDFEVKVDEKLSNFEGKIDQFQDSLTEQYDEIMVQIGQVDTINYYYGCDNSTTMPPIHPPVNMKDCTELYSSGFTSDGVYEIKPENGEPISVYCQEGWTVIQKRSDDSVNYTKNMEEYGRGFGQIDGEHWLGLNAMNKLTEQGNYTIRFELEAFDGETAWAEYSNFHVSPGTDYTLTYDLNSYRGTAGDSLTFFNHNNNKFTTYDIDQDEWEDGSCSTGLHDNQYGSSGWWFGSCGFSITAMEYGTTYSINWHGFKNTEPLKAVVMKIQRV